MHAATLRLGSILPGSQLAAECPVLQGREQLVLEGQRPLDPLPLRVDLRHDGGELALDGVEAEADALLGVDGEKINQSDAGSNGLQADDEVELVYAGLMENERGAQASAAHWEAKNLSDDDIADLGYGPEGDAADERTA